jgi:hypothetical protein
MKWKQASVCMFRLSDDCPERGNTALKNSLLAAKRPNEEFGIFHHVLNSGVNPLERYWVVDKFLSILSIIRPSFFDLFWPSCRIFWAVYRLSEVFCW